jgi:glycosyltransferase involved in cell wall biosynthesis
LPPVAVVVLTLNEELNLRACLESVSEWCEQIVVVDSGSTDMTVEIAREFGAEVLEHEYLDHASQWAWTLDHAPIRCPWVLALDADNRVSSRLRSDIGRVLAAENDAVDGYFVVHRHLFRNKEVRGLKGRWLRLVRHKRARVDPSELVDVRFVVDGPTRDLDGEIIESNQKELAIDFWIDKHQKFAERMAVEEVLRKANALSWSVRPRLLADPERRMVWLKNAWYRMPLYVRPLAYFSYRYFLRLGFLDGRNGLVFHTLQAFWFRLIVDVKIDELRRKLRTGDTSVEALLANVRPLETRRERR